MREPKVLRGGVFGRRYVLTEARLVPVRGLDVKQQEEPLVISGHELFGSDFSFEWPQCQFPSRASAHVRCDGAYGHRGPHYAERMLPVAGKIHGQKTLYVWSSGEDVVITTELPPR